MHTHGIIEKYKKKVDITYNCQCRVYVLAFPHTYKMKYVQVSKGRLHVEQSTVMSMTALLSSCPNWQKRENSNSQAILAYEEDLACR